MAARTTSRRSPIKLESEAEELFARDRGRAGSCTALEKGWFQRKIDESATRQQWEIEQQRRVIVGVNEFDTTRVTSSRFRCSGSAMREREQRSGSRERPSDARQRRCAAKARAASGGCAHDGESCFRTFSTARARTATLFEIRAHSRTCSERIANRSSSETAEEAEPNASGGSRTFDAQYLLEYQPIFTQERDRQEVARLIEILALPRGSRILDVSVRAGPARASARRSRATWSKDSTTRSTCSRRRAQRGTGTSLKYVRGDMRSLPATWTGRFDAVVNLFTSFGFFAEPSDDATRD